LRRPPVWVEGGDIHDELLDQLGGVLAPPEDLVLTPSAEELDALALAVAARWPGGATAPSAVAPAADPSSAETGGEVRRLRWAGTGTRRVGSSAWRAGSVAAGLVLFSASAAAAANGGVPLPDPVRVVAYTVGLPVDSPALHEVHQDIKQLNDAVKANDKPKAEAKAHELRNKDLPKVPADEKKVAVPKVEKALEDAVSKGMIPAPAPTTTTTVPPAPSTTAPAPAPSTTATTVENEGTRDKEKEDKEKDRSTVTTTAPSTTTTTEPEPTTDTTVPGSEDPADPNAGGGQTGSGGTGDPGTTPTTVPDETTTTTTTGPPPDETTTTTTTVPESTTTTTTAPPTAP
jgi:hypothetical protein